MLNVQTALPCSGIMTTAQTSMYFMKSSCMLFIGGLMVAIAIEHSNVHRHVFQEWLATLKKDTASVPSTYHLILPAVLRFGNVNLFLSSLGSKSSENLQKFLLSRFRANFYRTFQKHVLQMDISVVTSKKYSEVYRTQAKMNSNQFW
jgi:hypothetical protein